MLEANGGIIRPFGRAPGHWNSFMNASWTLWHRLQRSGRPPSIGGAVRFGIAVLRFAFAPLRWLPPRPYARALLVSCSPLLCD